MNTTRISLEKVAEFARARASSEGLVSTCVPGLHLMYIERPGDRVHSTYRPLVCLVLQGAKRITVGRQETVCSQGLSVIVSAGMPVNGQVIEASAALPYLALAMEFDWPSLSEQAELLNGGHRRAEVDPSKTLLTQPTETALLDCGLRLLQLAEAPEQVPFLLDGLRRELQYRLLIGPNGAFLRDQVSAHSSATRLTPAVAILRERFREAVRIEQLAEAAAMSRAVFHRHFKALTTLTPVQYQKRLRLIEARRLLRHEAASATKAAYEVGYESVPQFTRDYRSMFGTTPGQEKGLAVR